MPQTFRNVDWELTGNAFWVASIDVATLAVLMDIRQELRDLNRRLGCDNFTAMPRVLKQVRANTTTIARLLKDRGNR